VSAPSIRREIVDAAAGVARARFLFGPGARLTVLVRYRETETRTITYDARIVVGPEVAFSDPILVPIESTPNMPSGAERYDHAFANALACAIADHADALAGGPRAGDAVMLGGGMPLQTRAHALRAAYRAVPNHGPGIAVVAQCPTTACPAFGQPVGRAVFAWADLIIGRERYVSLPCPTCHAPGTSRPSAHASAA